MAIGKTKVDNLLRRVKLLNEVIAWVSTFDAKTKTEILDWIREDQLRAKGEDADGEVVGYYSLTTELISKGKKKFNTHYTLFDTGDFYRSFYVLVFQSEIYISANADKGEDNLFEKFGDKIVALNEENYKKLIDKVKNSFIQHARKVLQLD